MFVKFTVNFIFLKVHLIVGSCSSKLTLMPPTVFLIKIIEYAELYIRKNKKKLTIIFVVIMCNLCINYEQSN